ncbi:probable helicase MAGATAMA 3 [Spinacia oleracea]|uniref:Probable helicase MAGATAMA 3 n=1 Tax=Spinacia oleracea TaxID=3562 RepID=A0ABM3RG17_SPIOL|nr:probable helicase MAGATAMA 3 [Spinacia oleracea]
MLVIDEAAQLKECESLIPLQVPGVKNVILIGGDKQLPAMVQSKVAENDDFGRSLFERLSKYEDAYMTARTDVASGQLSGIKLRDDLGDSSSGDQLMELLDRIRYPSK